MEVVGLTPDMLNAVHEQRRQNIDASLKMMDQPVDQAYKRAITMKALADPEIARSGLALDAEKLMRQTGLEQQKINLQQQELEEVARMNNYRAVGMTAEADLAQAKIDEIQKQRSALDRLTGSVSIGGLQVPMATIAENPPIASMYNAEQSAEARLNAPGSAGASRQAAVYRNLAADMDREYRGYLEAGGPPTAEKMITKQYGSMQEFIAKRNKLREMAMGLEQSAINPGLGSSRVRKEIPGAGNVNDPLYGAVPAKMYKGQIVYKTKDGRYVLADGKTYLEF